MTTDYSFSQAVGLITGFFGLGLAYLLILLRSFSDDPVITSLISVGMVGLLVFLYYE